MSKHTDGPWIDGPQGIRHAKGFIAFTSAPREVPDACESGEGWLDMRRRTQPARDAVAAEQKANARLIAAAPEMFEALQKLIDCCDDSDGAQYGTLGTSFVRSIATAAIAKATGEQP
jgi:hypothetical protein